MKTLRRITKPLLGGYVILVLLANFKVLAGDPLPLRPEIEIVLTELNKKSVGDLPPGTSGLGDEMRRLANESHTAKQLLTDYFGVGISRPESFPRSPAELAMLWKWGGFASAAFRASDGKFDEMLTKYPSIVLESRLLGAMTKEDGEPVLLSATLYGSQFDANHHYIASDEIGLISIIEVATGESRGGFETEAQDFEIEQRDGRDVLVLLQKWRGDRDTGKQQVRTQKLRVAKNSTFELIEDKTELVPWTRGQGKPAPPQPSVSPIPPTQQPASNAINTPPAPSIVVPPN